MKGLKLNLVSSRSTWLLACVMLLFLISGCKKDDDNDNGNDTPQLAVTTVVSGLAGPMGVETDANGNIWVSEAGTDTTNADGSTYNNDGKVVIITSDGSKYDAIVNLESYANVNSGELQGTVHIFRDGNTLYVLSGDHLYSADISEFQPGDTPIDATTLPSEDIAAVISQIPSDNNPDNDSHPYDLTKGPDGDLYIIDAGANAIIHRTGENMYTILAEIPAIDNPEFPGLGGPKVQSVPTSIRYDGSNFIVTTLTGFPFPANKAIVYKVSMSGEVSVYQNGLTMVVDQAKGNSANQIVVQYATSFNPASGFAPDSGSLIWVNGSTTKVLADGLNQPSSIKQIDEHNWYVTSLGDGKLLKVSYQ